MSRHHGASAAAWKRRLPEELEPNVRAATTTTPDPQTMGSNGRWCGKNKSLLSSAITTTTTPASAKTTTTTTDHVTQDRKRSSLFRIKTGCVVALRLTETTTFQLSSIMMIEESNNRDENETLLSNERQHQQPAVSTQKRERQTRTIDFAAAGYVSVWTNPVAVRDCHLALVGKRIRCSFPKQQQVGGGAELHRSVLEGEIVRHGHCLGSIPSTSGDTARSEPPRRGDTVCSSSNDSNRTFTVELLIDKKMLQYFSFLTRLDEDVDLSKLKETARRRYLLEDRIRGTDKVIVVVTLQHPACYQNNNNNNRPTTTLESGLKWVIQKLVPSKLFYKSTNRRKLNGTLNGDDVEKETQSADDANLAVQVDAEARLKQQPGNFTENASIQKMGRGRPTDASSILSDLPVKKRRVLTGNSNNNNGAGASNSLIVTRHVGDGNDSADRQIANWRWLAGRYHDLLFSSSGEESPIDTMAAEFLSAGLVGQVLKVDTGASPSNKTLARVTLRRLFLPEHTVSGRQQHHKPNDVFTDYENDINGGNVQIEVLIEDLVIVGQKLHIGVSTNGEVAADDVLAQYSYSHAKNKYVPVPQSDGIKAQIFQDSPGSSSIDAGMPCCHRCRRNQISGDGMTECTSAVCPLAPPGCNDPIEWCNQCVNFLSKTARPSDETDGSGLPCCRETCDCRSCLAFAGSDLQNEFFAAFLEASDESKSIVQSAGEQNTLLLAAFIVRSTATINFGLPHDFVDANTLPIPQVKPSTRVKPRSLKKIRRKATANPGRPTVMSSKGVRTPLRKSAEKRSAAKINGAGNGDADVQKDDFSVFKPTCARAMVYDPSEKGRFRSSADLVISKGTEKPRNLRDVQEHSTRLTTEKKYDNAKVSSSSRAARVNQRRLMKDVTSLGAASLGLVDALANREPQLRFDRSGIHAWGVFADTAISAGEMIVEYRGELIGNAVAERRELEYEAAKIGSDYMFRIDSLNVCDATKQGNVARFINASCDPNCYTKIITLDGTKRIVIYSKKDISAGDELCYDYKFPVEYDESKRIPCHCGARECRGFMNWVCLTFALCIRATLRFNSRTVLLIVLLRTSATSCYRGHSNKGSRTSIRL